MHRRNTGPGQDSNLKHPDERPTPQPLIQREFSQTQSFVIVVPHKRRHYFYSVLESAYRGSHIVCWVPALFVPNQFVPGRVRLMCLCGILLTITDENRHQKNSINWTLSVTRFECSIYKLYYTCTLFQKQLICGAIAVSHQYFLVVLLPGWRYA